VPLLETEAVKAANDAGRLHRPQTPIELIAAMPCLVRDRQTRGPTELLHEPTDRALAVLQEN
jgi:hypothetical protein